MEKDLNHSFYQNSVSDPSQNHNGYKQGDIKNYAKQFKVSFACPSITIYYLVLSCEGAWILVTWCAHLLEEETETHAITYMYTASCYLQYFWWQSCFVDETPQHLEIQYHVMMQLLTPQKLVMMPPSPLSLKMPSQLATWTLSMIPTHQLLWRIPQMGSLCRSACWHWPTSTERYCNQTAC